MDLALIAVLVGLISSAVTVATFLMQPPTRLVRWLDQTRRAGGAGVRRLPRFWLGRQTFTVGCFHYPPLSIRLPQAGETDAPQFDGPWPRLIREVAVILGEEVRLVPVSASDFENGASMKVDFVVGLFQTPHRALAFDFSAPFHRIRLQGICRRGRPKISKEELSSGSLRIAVQSGEVGWEYVQEQLAHLPHGLVQQFGTPATFEVVDHLLSGKYDVAICDEISCLTFLEDPRNNRKYQLAFEWPTMVYPSCIAVRKTLSWPLARLTAAMKKARNDSAFLQYEEACLSGPYARAVERCYIGARYDAPAP